MKIVRGNSITVGNITGVRGGVSNKLEFLKTMNSEFEISQKALTYSFTE